MEKPVNIMIEAPLSLNRMPITLKVHPSEHVQTSTADPLPDISPVFWHPERLNQVIVDDLDPGFSSTGSGIPREQQTTGWLHFFVQSGLIRFVNQQQMDYGLPVYSWINSQKNWSRVQHAGFGRYRNTFARVFTARGTTDHKNAFTAEFAAHLPKLGEWQLGYSIPTQIIVEQMLRNRGNSRSNSSNEHGQSNRVNIAFTLTVQVADQIIPLELDQLEFKKSEVDLFAWKSMLDYEADVQENMELLEISLDEFADSYWVSLGSFEITNQHVIVITDNKSYVSYTFADAVRWTRVEQEDID